MPRKTTQIEAQIEAALAAMDANPFLKASVAARDYAVPYRTLLRRHNGGKPSNSRGGHNKKLNSVQDQALRDYIFMLHGCGTPANLETVLIGANRLLFYSTGDLKQTVSRRWVKRWIQRQSEYLKTLKSKPISAKRLNSHKVEEIEEHFKAFQKCKDYWGIQDTDVYNFDETGFQIGVSTGEKVLVPIDCKAVYTADPENRELITSVETIGYGGHMVPPFIIFSGAYHLRRNFKNNIDEGITMARSDSGYSNDKLGVKYLKHFDDFTRSKTVGLYRMLLFDGHGSHLSQDFIDCCWQRRIRPFQLPPHSTHLLQPLDVAVFQSLKHNFQKELRKQITLGAREVSRHDFFAFFQSFHDKTFKNPRIHKRAFEKTGLIPLNPLRVLEKMREYRAIERPVTPPLARHSSPLILSSSPAFNTPPLQLDWEQFQTPLTIRSRKRGVEYIRKRQFDALDGIPLTPSVIHVSNKVEKASEASILSGALATHRLYDLATAETARKKLKEESGKVVQKYGEIRVYQARLDLQQDEADEKEVINMRDKRIQKVWRKKFIQVIRELNQVLEQGPNLREVDIIKGWE